jgi:hypothetical protein
LMTGFRLSDSFSARPKRYFEVLCLLLLAVRSIHGADPQPVRPPLIRDFMGLNGHTVQFRPHLYRPIAAQVRDYHPVEWDLGRDSDYVPAFPMARNGVDWSKVYGSWRREGWHIDASMMFETLPRDRWKNLTNDAKAYAERFARAFGPSAVEPLVDSVEIGNEPGKFTDADYRLMFENMAGGFKAGDLRLRVATCALTTRKSHDYAKSVDCITGLERLYDVLNVHTYAQLEAWPTWRRSYPEDSRLKDYLLDVRRLCEWRDLHAPGKELWITEFGYDSSTRPPDPKGEFKEWKGITDKQQAQWIVRSWLVFAALPVERAYLYFFNDEDAPQLHGAAGLTRHFLPKPAFYAVAHLQRSLGEYRFSRVVLQRNDDACVYEFRHGTDPSSSVWVAWSPTGSDRATSFELPSFRGVIERAERMPLSETDAPTISPAPDARHVPLTESPLYLFLRAG